MPRIEFFYIEDCPSHERALEILREVLADVHIQDRVEITEIKTEKEQVRYAANACNISVLGLLCAKNLSGADCAEQRFLAYNQSVISNSKGAFVWIHF